MASPVTLKKNYRCFKSLQQFYTGGPYAVSSDGSFFVCACDDDLKIIDSSNASIKSTIQGDSEPVTALVLSPNDAFLFSTSHSRQIRVWDLVSLKCIRSWKGHEGPVMGMACHASGGLLATAGADKKVQVWDVDGGFCTHYFKGHKGVVTSIKFHPDPSRLLLFSGGDDATVRVWDLTSKGCLATLEKHQSVVTSIAISEDGWTLLSGGRDKARFNFVVNIWDLHNYTCATTVPTYEAVEAVCIIDSASPFASCLSSSVKEHGKNFSHVPFITVGERGIVRIWNSDGAKLLFEQKRSDVTIILDKEDVKRGFTSALMLPLGQGLLCVTADQQFLIYVLEENAEVGLNLTLSKRLIGYNEEIADMKFLGDEEHFLAVATSVEQVRVYDVASMSCSYVLSGHTDVVLCLDTCVQSPGRSLIVTGSKDNSVRLWDSQNRRCIAVGIGHMGAVGAIAFSKKNRNFFVSGSSDRTLKVWSLDGDSDDVKENSNLKVKAVVAAHDKDINSLAVAPNDSLICSGSQDRTACVWRLPDLVSVVVLKGHKRGIWSVEFSPVDQCVITASGDKTIRIWAISDGADGLVKLWTVKTNECVATYDQHEDKIWALAIGRKTEMIATGGGDAVINLWHDSTATDKEEAFRKEEEGVLRGQELENAIFDADYLKAVQLAFELRRPHKLFELFSELCRKSDGKSQIEKAVCSLSKEELHKLLEYTRDWNTKPKLCHVAHFVLSSLFSIIPPTEIIEIKGIGELLEGLIPYTQRHFSRVDRLESNTFLFDYTLAGMSVLEPEGIDTESRDEDMNHSDITEEEPRPEAISSRKKRRSQKSREKQQKKSKVAYTSVAATAIC
ncbi:transducin beta-like protein 3 [Dorcoceras hygrometricum]|uniref:Transducin beta-like protein 3 n=1 Tax=Dorcoceras hygrometricum TaxID=472368 RepID=A0A2Z7BXM5_9LAMI|nr:transducin beta-like protein 3 [Dorcoceras hygrometricum]